MDLKLIDSRPVHTSSFSELETSSPWAAAGKKGFILQTHLRERNDELDIFAVEVSGPQDFNLVYENRCDFENRASAVRDFVSNASTKMERYGAELREVLL